LSFCFVLDWVRFSKCFYSDSDMDRMSSFDAFSKSTVCVGFLGNFFNCLTVNQIIYCFFFNNKLNICLSSFWSLLSVSKFVLCYCLHHMCVFNFKVWFSHTSNN